MSDQTFWKATRPDGTAFFRTPINDLTTHTETDDCHCGPRLEIVTTGTGDRWLTIHHSLDGRERYE